MIIAEAFIKRRKVRRKIKNPIPPSSGNRSLHFIYSPSTFCIILNSKQKSTCADYLLHASIPLSTRGAAGSFLLTFMSSGKLSSPFNVKEMEP